MKAITYFRNLKNRTYTIDSYIVEALISDFCDEERALIETRHIRTQAGHESLVIELNKKWNKLVTLVYDDAQFIVTDDRFRADMYFKVRSKTLYDRAIKEHNDCVSSGEHTKEA